MLIIRESLLLQHPEGSVYGGPMNRKCRPTTRSGMRQRNKRVGHSSRSFDEQALGGCRMAGVITCKTTDTGHWVVYCKRGAGTSTRARDWTCQGSNVGGIVRACTRCRDGPRRSRCPRGCFFVRPEYTASDMIDRHSRDSESTWNMDISGGSRFLVV